MTVHAQQCSDEPKFCVRAWRSYGWYAVSRIHVVVLRVIVSPLTGLTSAASDAEAFFHDWILFFLSAAVACTENCLTQNATCVFTWRSLSLVSKSGNALIFSYPAVIWHRDPQTFSRLTYVHALWACQRHPNIYHMRCVYLLVHYAGQVNFAFMCIICITLCCACTITKYSSRTIFLFRHCTQYPAFPREFPYICEHIQPQCSLSRSWITSGKIENYGIWTMVSAFPSKKVAIDKVYGSSSTAPSLYSVYIQAKGSG